MTRKNASFILPGKESTAWIVLGTLGQQRCVRDSAVSAACGKDDNDSESREALIQVGGLISWKGTVTRTTEVRPELYLATYKCQLCGELARNVEQQFVMTTPMICSSMACGNKKAWTLVKEESSFVDWQRAKVQENADEVWVFQ